MWLLKYCVPVITVWALFLVAGTTAFASESSSVDNFYPVPTVDPENQRCIEECLHRNQMAAVGFSALEMQCRQACQFDKALQASKSSNKDERLAAIKFLCSSNDRRAVQPLINALKRDLEERTGIWAWIIPALGDLRDQEAVPILTETLTVMDDDWLGREMSAKALGTIGEPSSVPYLLAAAWRGDTRDAAIDALAKYQDKRVIPALLSALDPAEEQQTRAAAIAGLRHQGSVAIPEMIREFAKFSPEYPETRKRLWLCDLLGNSGDARAMKQLHDSRSDPDRTIAECAEKYSVRRHKKI